MRHHTKDKGDLGMGMVVADLLSQGIQVAFTMSEHLPFDVVAISPRMDLARVQVRYAKANQRGNLAVKLTTSWADKNGSHSRSANMLEIDGFAIYSPDTGKVYYVSATECRGNRSTFTLGLAAPKTTALRVRPSAIREPTRYRLADDYRDPGILFRRWRAKQDQEHNRNKSNTESPTSVQYAA